MASLQGLRVVITRAIHQADELAGLLRDLGAEVLSLPLIEIAPPADLAPLRDAAENCHRYDWIIFSSANAVDAFMSVVPAGVRCSAKIATVGQSTRRACETRGLHVHITPEKFVAESLVSSLAEQELLGKRILIPSAAAARELVPSELRKMGASVDVVEAYRTVQPLDSQVRVEELLREPYPDWILFASPSALKNLCGFAAAERINRMRVAAIGPVTAAAARSLGVNVTVEAEVSDAEGLVKAILTSPSVHH